MAYLNFLIAVDPAEIAELRSHSNALLHPSMQTSASHLIGQRGWNDFQPLQTILAEALDGGDPLSPELWHPLRPPIYHPPASVVELHAALSNAWADLLNAKTLADDDWGRFEIEKVAKIFAHAAQVPQGIVSILEPPADEERAQKVRIPFIR